MKGLFQYVVLAVLVVLLCLVVSKAFAAEATFSWRPNSETNLVGYRIHYGPAPRTYTTVVETGLPALVDGRVHHTVTNIPEGNTMFFAATAYDTNDLESDYSTEIGYDVPITPPDVVPTPEPPQEFSVDPMGPVFTWEPNIEPELSSYEIYCSTTPTAELTGSHELWKSVAPSSIIGGRVSYTWEDFPEGVQYYCVSVALGSYDGERRSSAFSEEVSFTVAAPAPTIPVPQDFRMEITQ